MLTLEQIRSLESKVTKAVTLLASFQEENKVLKSRLSQYETRIEELEFMIEEYKEEQGEIEQGIISALEHLDNLEGAVGGLIQPAASSTRHASTEDKVAQPAQQVAAQVHQPVPAPATPQASLAQPLSESEITTESFDEEALAEEETGFKSENQQLDIF